jgi:zinc transport system ATP-binding protein
MEPLLKISHLHVHLDGRELIHDLSFEVKERETLVILGPNGAGKTVLLRTLLGLIPCRGEIHWRHGVTAGYVPQRVPLNRDLPISVADFFRLKEVAPEQAGPALERVGLSPDPFLGRPLGLLSSGQFQRVLIAWALVNRRDILLFDEPTAGIDVGGEETIYALLKRAQKESRFSVILVTHDLSTVTGLADHVLCMNQSEFCYGPPRKVLTPKILQEIYGSEMKFFRHAHR